MASSAKQQAQLSSQAAAIAATLRQRWPDRSLWLFGSVLGPGLHADSDLDLAVERRRLAALIDSRAGLAER